MNENVMQSDELEIDLLELLHVLLRKWWLIFIGGLVGAIAMMLVTSHLITPMYESQAMLYILNKTTSVTSFADIQIGSAVSQDFAIIATSKPVIDGAIKELEAEYGKTFTRDDIAHMIKVSNIEDTRILCITVTSENPEDACAIANAVAETTAAQMAQIMKSDPPTIVEEAEVEAEPVSPSMLKNIMLGFVGAVFLICAVLVVRYLLDDSIKNEEQISKYLGVSTLATIPYISDKDRKKAELKQQKEGKHAK